MKSMSIRGLFARGWLWLAGAGIAWLCTPLAALAALEETYPVLNIGAQVYTNVTVTTKAKDYIFILHSSGMANIKVADLPPDVQADLGYVVPQKTATTAVPQKEVVTNAVSGWTKQVLAKIRMPEVRAMDQQLAQALRGQTPVGSLRLLKPSKTILLAIFGLGLVFYLFGCYCCQLICQKAGYDPGLSVWLPLLKWVPLFRAAGMSGWWFLALFVPGLSLVACILWSVKIVQARGKSFWVTLFLLLPLTTVLAFLYLAFSNGAAPKKKKDDRRIEIMTLETA